MASNSKKQRTLQGLVTSDKMSKTRVVSITRLKQHPKYLQYYKVTRRFKAHDAGNEYKVGDKVVIAEMRPMSKEKRWKIIGLVKSEARSPKSETNSNLLR